MFDMWFPRHWSTLKKLIWLYKGVMKAASWVWKTVTGSLLHITDALAGDVSALSVAINPVQSLNGYDNPWPAGGGANKMPAFAAESKTLGTTTCSMDGNGTFTLKAVSDSTARTFTFDITPFTTPASGYLHLLNSAASNGITMSFRDANDGAIGSSFAFSDTANKIIELGNDRTEQLVSKIRVYKNAATTDIDLTFSPMLLATNTVTPYVPYSNICPISGWTHAEIFRTGKNIYDDSNFEIDGKYAELHGIHTPSTADATKKLCGIYLKGGQTYRIYIDFGETKQFGVYAARTGLSTQIQVASNSSRSKYNATYTPTYDGWYCFWLYASSGWSSLTKADFTVQIYADDEAYSQAYPYVGTSVTIDLDGTRYGGTLDVLTGVLTVDRAKFIIDGGSNLKVNYAYPNKSVFNFASNSSGLLIPADSNSIIGAIADKIPNISDNVAIANIQDGFSTGDSGNFRKLAMPSTGLTTVSDMNTWLSNNPITVVAPLATPLTVQLDPETLSTLLGANNIWADTGDTTMTYMAQEA